MKLRLEQVTEALGVSDVPQRGDTEILGWTVDSRNVKPGDLFFALHGPNFDGHDYVKAALESGAVAAVVDRDLDLTERLVRVNDTLAALQALASWARVRWAGTVVGVTGSAGKTTTKDAIA